MSQLDHPPDQLRIMGEELAKVHLSIKWGGS